MEAGSLLAACSSRQHSSQGRQVGQNDDRSREPPISGDQGRAGACAAVFTFRANRGSCLVVGARLLVCSLAMALLGAVFVASILFVLVVQGEVEEESGGIWRVWL